MKDLEFTPGRWEAVDYAGYWQIQDGTMYDDVDLLNEEKCSEASANAKLMSKAPEMYEALKKIKEAYEHALRYHTVPAPDKILETINKLGL